MLEKQKLSEQEEDEGLKDPKTPEEEAELLEKSKDNLSEEKPESESSEEEKSLIDLEGEKINLEQVKQWKKDAESYRYFRPEYTRATQKLSNLQEQLEEKKTASEQYAPEEQQGIKFLQDLVEKSLSEKLTPYFLKQEDKEVEDERQTLVKKYRVSDDESYDVMRFAADQKIPSLELAYKAMLYDVKMDEAKRLGHKEALKNLEKKKAALVESGSGESRLASKRPSLKNKSYDEITELASRELGE